MVHRGVWRRWPLAAFAEGVGGMLNHWSDGPGDKVEASSVREDLKSILRN